MNPPPLPVRRRYPWILYWIVLVLIVLVAFAPVGSVVACGLIANAHGCRVDEGSVHPLHDQWKRLWATALYPWCDELADARHAANRSIRVRSLADRSYFSSSKSAKARRSQSLVVRRQCRPSVFRCDSIRPNRE